jgi:hypothetical protein
MAPSRSEADKFDAVVRTLLSVSHEEIKKRDKEWRRKRKSLKENREKERAKAK